MLALTYGVIVAVIGLPFSRMEYSATRATEYEVLLVRLLIVYCELPSGGTMDFIVVPEGSVYSTVYWSIRLF